jgi:hypothetical protein
VYDKDRIDLVEPDAALHLNRQLLDAFPKGYRHLAYLQTRIGYTVKKDIRGAVLEAKGGPFVLQDLDDEPRSDEILFKIVASGICRPTLTHVTRKCRCR